MVDARRSPVPPELLQRGRVAPARTVLPHGRLSEDIDLLALGNRFAVAAGLHRRADSLVQPRFIGDAYQSAPLSGLPEEPVRRRCR